MKLRDESLSILLKKILLIKYNIIYIEKLFSLKKKKIKRYIFNNKEYFIITIKK